MILRQAIDYDSPDNRGLIYRFSLNDDNNGLIKFSNFDDYTGFYWSRFKKLKVLKWAIKLKTHLPNKKWFQ